MLSENIARIAHNKAETQPTKIIIVCAEGTALKRVCKRIITKIPAVTNVDEWINADAGIGAFIAFFNQDVAPICADFIKMETRRINVMTNSL